MELEEESELKEIILNRLFETSSHCSLCLKFDCKHQVNRELNSKLKVENVLKAINFDRTFYEDKP